ncbi:MAG: uracil-DNA glycosylase [Azoarcus sp.]|jgi:DNA polymerase|nr:uracil-DNA glycosylase [Azoarcus sp.]
MNPASRRNAILREMGLAPLWRLRMPAESSAAAAEGEVAAEMVAASVPVAVSEEIAASAPAFAANAQPVSPVATMGWQELEDAIRACRACGLCERRTQAVPGVGDRQARWMFVGEGPGAEEDRRGEPFVGQAGQLLDRMLAALGLERGKDVYIANAVKCRPPHNRTPEAAETAACAPFLDRQIALVRPRLLIALGRPAAQVLLGREISIAAARGKRFERDGVAVIVTYHPAYLLRNPQDKDKAWEDLCFARRLVAEGEREAG